jgi:hypothetical protein
MADEEVWKFNYFTMQKYIIFKKFLYKRRSNAFHERIDPKFFFDGSLIDFSHVFFFWEKNRGYIPNQSFEFSENRGASEPVPPS